MQQVLTRASVPFTRAERSYLSRHVAVVFLGVLAIGAPVPVLALFVHDGLGFSAASVGWVIGLQSLATVATRHSAGTLADRFGPRRIVCMGLPTLAMASPFYLLASMPTLSQEWRLVVLLLARVLLGIGESLLLTGTMSWGIGAIGVARAGAVMSWQGIAMYAAFGLGAPLGLATFAHGGLPAVAALAFLTPLVALFFLLGLAPIPGTGGERVPFYRVISLIWRQGVVLMLGTIPFAAMTTFLVLVYGEKGWQGAGTALAAFGIGYILVRLLVPHWPDRYGGARVAGWSLVVEAVGQCLLWLAPHPAVALAGAALSGVGFSLIFPAMGVDATRRVPANQRGRAVGNFIAFFDIAIGVTGPLVGLFVVGGNYARVFGIGALCTLCAVALLLASAREPRVS